MGIIPSDSGLGGVDTLPARQVMPCPVLISPTFFTEVPAQSYMVSSIVFFIPRRQLGLGRTPAHMWWEDCHSSDGKDGVEDSGWKNMRNLQGSLHPRLNPQIHWEQLLWESMISHWPPTQKLCGIVTGFHLRIIKNLLGTTHHHSLLFFKKML